MNDDIETARIVANEARQLLDNRHFKEAFSAVEKYLQDALLSCDVDNKDKVQRIAISQQLLVAVKRELIRKVEDGDMAEIELSELERRKGLLRFVR